MRKCNNQSLFLNMLISLSLVSCQKIKKNCPDHEGQTNVVWWFVQKSVSSFFLSSFSPIISISSFFILHLFLITLHPIHPHPIHRTSLIPPPPPPGAFSFLALYSFTSSPSQSKHRLLP
ncbi:MAG: hypothetical protein BYD32DRAFT_222372 [Podila humilis]|nr:MAG: hypothetical protein BYD32DRAFT_222372 [Podila humilis]